MTPQKPHHQLMFVWLKDNQGMIVIKLKIIVATYQVVASIGDVISVDFPETFTDFINGFSFMDLNLWNVVPLSCAVHISFIDKLLLVTLAPLAATSLLWVCFLLEYSYHRYHIQKNVNRRRGEKRNKFQELKEKYVNFLFYLSYLVLPGVTSTIFEIFICQDIDPNDEDKKDSDIYLVVDPTISCHSDYYYNGRLYAIFMILIYPVIPF